MNNLTEIIAASTGLYEIIARGLPTKKNYSIIHGILKALMFLSTLLNNQKQSINNIKSLFIIFIISLFCFSCSITKDFTCLSKKQVAITIIDKNGLSRTATLNYCDSILYSKISDTTKAVKFVKSKSIKDQ